MSDMEGKSLTYHSKKPFSEVDHIVNADGIYLYCKYWKPKDEIRALMFFSHGYAEHCGRYDEIADKMKSLGVYSFAHDHVGHGESEGERGAIRDYRIFVRDMWQHIDHIRKEYQTVPLFLYGHSMGGGLVLSAVHGREDVVRGIILSAALIKPSPDTATPVKLFLAKTLSYLAPSLRVGKLDFRSLSRSKTQVESYLSDPLVDTGGMRAAFGVQMLKMCKDLENILPNINLPFFIAHSEIDQLTDCGGSKLLVEVAKSNDKTYHFYKDAFHMLEHENPEFVEAYFADVLRWLEEHI